MPEKTWLYFRISSFICLLKVFDHKFIKKRTLPLRDAGIVFILCCCCVYTEFWPQSWITMFSERVTSNHSNLAFQSQSGRLFYFILLVHVSSSNISFKINMELINFQHFTHYWTLLQKVRNWLTDHMSLAKIKNFFNKSWDWGRTHQVLLNTKWLVSPENICQ